jgi:hypothetical protein
MLLLQFVFGAHWLHPLLSSLACYAMLALTQRVRALDRWRHWLCAVFSLAYLTWRHATRGDVDASSIDDLVVQMVLTVKLYTLAYNLYDGTGGRPGIDAKIAEGRAALAAAAGDAALEKKARSALRVYEDRRARSISALPSLLEYAGYVFNFTTVLVGPSFEITEYLRSQQDWAGSAGTPAVSRFPAACVKLAQGLGFMAANVVLAPLFPVERVYTNATDPEVSFLWSVLYGHCAFTVLRGGYYFCWKVAEAAAIVAGFGFQPPGSSSGKRADSALSTAPAVKHGFWTSVEAWSGVANMDVGRCELPRGLSDIMRHWNTHTQSWLERYIFLRAPRAYGLNRWITFFASAFWHGLFIGYYLGFVSVPLLQLASQKLYAVFRPLLTARDGARRVPQSSLLYKGYAVLRGVVTCLSLNYCLSAFNLYTLQKSLAVWRGWYYYGHALPVALYLLSTLVGVLAPRRRGDLAPATGKNKAQ